MSVEEQLKRHEGFRAKPYRDTIGKLTIGYGRNLDDVGLTEGEATLLLRGDIADAAKRLYAHYPEWCLLAQTRREVLLNMSFNLGYRLAGFRKMWSAIERQDFEDAAKEMLNSKWATQVGQRADELAEQMRRG